MQKGELHQLLKDARATNLGKLQGLDEYDLRRPLTPTATNLLGVVKHLGGMEYGYLGETFGRYLARLVPGDEDPDNLGDFWATAAEPAADIVAWYREACEHADETIEALDLEQFGSVLHWPQPHRVTLEQMMLRVLGEDQRHGGHLDIVRELIDATTSPTTRSESWWSAHRARLQLLAESFR